MVYGVPAIAVGIERGVEAVATLTPAGGGAQLVVDQRIVHRDEDVGRAFAALLAQLKVSDVSVRARSAMPVGVGLGASAALGVAIARAVAEQCERVSDQELLAGTHAWEEVFHGNPSGVDAACALSGGCIRFEKGKGFVPLSLPRVLRLAIAVAGPASSTKEMVDAVARQKERKPDLFNQNLEAIRTLVRNAELALTTGDYAGLGTLLNYNQMLLASWMLSTEAIEQACRAAREAGALGAKLTGAGGGGCVIALCGDGGSEPILAAWRALGFECFETRVPAR